MSRPARSIVFDLDGTLVQTRIASWEVFRDVQAEFGLGIDDPETFFSFFEGNFFASLRASIPDHQKADAVVGAFFARLEDDYHPAAVPGMVEVARTLAARCTLAVLSSNATGVIRRALAENGLQYCFSHVFGGDVEPDKTAGLRRFLADAAQGVGRRCSAPYDEGSERADAAPDDTVLVTDTVGDVEAAVAAGVRAVGVSWGMHSEERLRAAGAEFVAVWPQELVAYLLPSDAMLEGAGTCALPPTPSPALAASPARPVEIRRARRLQGASTVFSRTRTAAPEPAGSCGCPVERASAAVPRTDAEEMREAMRSLIGSAG